MSGYPNSERGKGAEKGLYYYEWTGTELKLKFVEKNEGCPGGLKMSGAQTNRQSVWRASRARSRAPSRRSRTGRGTRPS
jgi:hypothetical protein